MATTGDSLAASAAPTRLNRPHPTSAGPPQRSETPLLPRKNPHPESVEPPERSEAAIARQQ